jgi:FixJ family two-component response regulator
LEHIVFVVDDDPSMRVALTNLFRSMDLNVEVFSSTAELLQSELPNIASCLVLDIRLPGVNGLEFQQTLAKTGIHIPVVFITGYGDIPMSVRAMKAGAAEFLTKPLDDEIVIQAIREAVLRSQASLKQEGVQRHLEERLASLTKREREVMNLVVKGLMNKQVGYELDISEITVKAHRGRVMEKMHAVTFVDLVNMAGRLGISTAREV